MYHEHEEAMITIFVCHEDDLEYRKLGFISHCSLATKPS